MSHMWHVHFLHDREATCPLLGEFKSKKYRYDGGVQGQTAKKPRTYEFQFQAMS